MSSECMHSVYSLLWDAKFLLLFGCFFPFLSVFPKSRMKTNIFPNAEVSHFLKRLKTKDGVEVHVGMGV